MTKALSKPSNNNENLEISRLTDRESRQKEPSYHEKVRAYASNMGNFLAERVNRMIIAEGVDTTLPDGYDDLNREDQHDFRNSVIKQLFGEGASPMLDPLEKLVREYIQIDLGEEGRHITGVISYLLTLSYDPESGNIDINQFKKRLYDYLRKETFSGFSEATSKTLAELGSTLSIKGERSFHSTVILSSDAGGIDPNGNRTYLYGLTGTHVIALDSTLRYRNPNDEYDRSIESVPVDYLFERVTNWREALKDKRIINDVPKEATVWESNTDKVNELIPNHWRDANSYAFTVNGKKGPVALVIDAPNRLSLAVRKPRGWEESNFDRLEDLVVEIIRLYTPEATRETLAERGINLDTLEDPTKMLKTGHK